MGAYRIVACLANYLSRKKTGGMWTIQGMPINEQMYVLLGTNTGSFGQFVRDVRRSMESGNPYSKLLA